MDLSRESQKSTNTSEVEESVEVRNTCNRSFLLSIRYFDYNFVSTTSPLSTRNQTHVIARALARPVENKVLPEVVLVEEIIDCVLISLSSSELQTKQP